MGSTWVTLLLLLFTAVLHAQQVRDPSASTASTEVRGGTALLSGVVQVDDTASAPVRGAVVTLSGEGLPTARTVVTDDEGRFAFGALPAGRFMVSAKKAPFVTTAYGARRPGRPGTAITVAAGQQVTGLAVRLPRGAVITGRVTDGTTGAPMADIPMAVSRTDTTDASGIGALQPPPATTDERGVYRMFGLVPGEYVVVATAALQTVTGVISGRSETEVDAVLQALQQRPRAVGTAPRSASASPTPPVQAYGYAPIYYPGTASSTDATRIRVVAGEERSGVDVRLTLVRTVTITGVVSTPVGPLPAIGMTITSTGEPSPVPQLPMASRPTLSTAPGVDGRFVYTSVPPGRYTITARATDAAAGRGVGAGAPGNGLPGQPSTMATWATADVVVDGTDIAGLSLTLQPAMRLMGRIEIERPTLSQPPPAPSTIRVQLLKGGVAGMSMSSVNGTVMGNVPIPVVQGRDDGTFEVSGVLPGTYQLRVTGASGGWWLRSAIVGGRDVLDYPLTFGVSGDITGATLVFSDRHAELAGTLQDTGGRGVADYVVVVFPADRALWRPDSRRLKSARPATDGAFVLSDLPPGDYLLAALTDFDPADVRDPAFLEQVAGASIKVSIADGERKRQDIRIAR